MADDTWLVVGLGNPGAEYAANRHNVGVMAVELLAARIGGSFKRHKTQAVVLEGRLGHVSGGAPGPALVLAKPLTYMNESGGPVSALARFYKTDPEHVLVVHDEIDIPFAELRLKRGGGEGGHNGLRSISRSLSTRDYARLRIGVGRPQGRMDPADFVLRDFSAIERRELGVLLEQAADAIELVVGGGLLAAQQQVHSP